MSSWTNYKPPIVMVDTGDGEQRPVRGLALEDFSDLIVGHLDELMDLTAVYIQSKDDVFSATNMTDVVIMASKQFPALVSEVISMVTDTPELKGTRLGVGLQVKILQAAFKLTVEDAGGLGNLSAMLQNVVKAAAQGRQGEASLRLKDTLSRFSTTGAAKTPVS